MASDPVIPDTRVLAIASHVVHGYVGNKMATFVMQSLGCDVSAINTVNYSNHLAYKQVKGTKASAEQIQELYEGLRQSNLSNFDVLLTGYIPSAEAVQAVGKIGRDIKFNAGTKPGSFFWVLDPVMGDNGQLYIPEDEVPEYKALLREADLILPNQFEAEILSDTTITDLKSLAAAIQILHTTYQVPHVIITSLRLTPDNQMVSSRASSRTASKPTSGTHTPSKSSQINTTDSLSGLTKLPPDSTQPTNPPKAHSPNSENDISTLTIIGSTATSDHQPRLFRIDVPAFPLFFSGTGDMFAALIIPRLIESVQVASSPGSPRLASTPSWRSPDNIGPEQLPLAHACQKVLASMQAILAKTTLSCEQKMQTYDRKVDLLEAAASGKEARREMERKRHLALMAASEVTVPRFVGDLLDPPGLERFRPRALDESGGGGDGEKMDPGDSNMQDEEKIEEEKTM